MFERNYKLLNNKYWEFLIPTILTVMTGNLGLVIDSIIVSTLVGVVSLAGIQVVSPISSIFSLFCWMIGLGGSVLYTATKAEFDKENANKIFTVAIVSITLIGLIISIIGQLFTGDIINFLSSSAEANVYAIQFFRMYVMCVPFLCYILCLYYFIRGEGKTRLTFKSSLLYTILNLSMDIIFMKFLNMGIAGAGLATTLAYVIASVYVTVSFFRSNTSLKLVKVKLGSYIKTLMEICKNGYAGSSNQLYTFVSGIVYNTMLISYAGHVGLFSLQICNNTFIILSIFLIGLMQAASPILSVYFKEEDYSGINYIKNKSLKLIFIVGLAFSLFLLLFPDVLLTIYSVSDQSSQFVLNAIRLFGLRYLTVGITVFYVFYLQAMQKNKLANIVSIFNDLIFVVVLLYTLTYAFGVVGIWISYICINLVTLSWLYFYSRYLHKKSRGEYEGFFINRPPRKNVYEYTINANAQEVEEFSSYIMENHKDNPFAEYSSLSLKEFLLDTIKKSDGLDTIDVLVKIEENSFVLFIKDAGAEREGTFTFNQDNPNYTRDVKHSRILGLNSTEITIS